MNVIKFTEFKQAVGQGFITMKTHNFPTQGFARKTVGNVIYLWALPSMVIVKLPNLEATGKQVKLCIVPKQIVKYAGI